VEALANGYAMFLDSVELLKLGILTPVLVNETTIRDTIAHIQGELGQTNVYKLIHTEVGYYYTTESKLTYGRRGEFLFITQNFKLTSFDSPFTVYKIKKYPIPLFNDTQHMTVLDNEVEVIAIEKARTYYIQLKESEINSLDTRILDSEKRVFQNYNTQDCLIAIF